MTKFDIKNKWNLMFMDGIEKPNKSIKKMI